MATKYCRVDKAPENLKDKEMIIALPDFKEEISRAKRAKGVQPFFTVNYLRAIFLEIGGSLDPEFNAYSDFNATKYKGKAISDDISSDVFGIVEIERPDLIEKAVELKVKSRASDIELIYFVAPDLTYASAFTKNGIDSVQAPKKTKKTETKE